jgi:hypothetical protein
MTNPGQEPTTSGDTRPPQFASITAEELIGHIVRFAQAHDGHARVTLTRGDVAGQPRTVEQLRAVRRADHVDVMGLEPNAASRADYRQGEEELFVLIGFDRDVHCDAEGSSIIVRWLYAARVYTLTIEPPTAQGSRRHSRYGA